MAENHTRIPTDDEIKLEVAERIKNTSQAEIDRLGGKAYPENLFNSIKRKYTNNKPVRVLTADEQEKAYITKLVAQGIPILEQDKLQDKFPRYQRFSGSKMTQNELQRHNQIATFMYAASAITHKVHAIEQKYFTAGRKKLLETLGETYGLYRRIKQSDVSEETFDSFAATLKAAFKIATHNDTPDATTMVKLLYVHMTDKTAHLYARAIQFAYMYEVEEADFHNFIKEVGGLEKIRKAYAMVLAADKGKKNVREFNIDEVTTLNFLASIPTFKVVPLTSQEANQIPQDDLKYCYLLAHVDPMNELEIIAPIPISPQLQKLMLSSITQATQNNNEWQSLREKIASHTTAKEKEREAKKKVAASKKALLKQKKTASIAKKNAAFAKSAAKAAAKTSSSQKVAPIKPKNAKKKA